MSASPPASATDPSVPAAKVTVVVPCYNGERYLAETIRSVQQQTFQDWRMLIVDDGSQDNSVQIAQSFAQADARIAVLPVPHGGLPYVRNVGLQATETPYLATFDADDLMLPENLARKVAYLDAHPAAGAVASHYVTFDATTGQDLQTVVISEENVLVRMLSRQLGTPHMPSALVIRTEAARAIGGWDLDIANGEDRDFTIRLAAQYPIGVLPEVLVRYRVHPGQMSRNLVTFERDDIKIARKAWAQGLYRSTSFFRWCQAHMQLIVAASYARDQRNWLAAARHLVRSLTWHPGPIVQRLLGKR